MTRHFTISAFADEISPAVYEQIRVLQENQIRHIELRGLDGKNVSELTLAEAQGYRRLFDEAEIAVSSIGSPIGKINIQDDFAPHLALFKHVLQVAEIFGSPYVRMFSFFIDERTDPDAYEEEVTERWRAFLAAAAAYPQITLLHENEKGIYGDTPERCLRLIQNLNAPQLQLAFDPANFVQCQVEVYPHAYQMLEPHIAYLHIKDARFSDHEVTPAGLGDGCLQTVLQQLAAAGFQGFASIEPHLSMFEGFAELEQAHTAGLAEADASDQVRLFNVAAQALRKILVEDLGQEWQ